MAAMIVVNYLGVHKSHVSWRPSGIQKKGVSSNGSSENCYLASQIAVELFLPPGFHCQVLQGEKKN